MRIDAVTTVAFDVGETLVDESRYWSATVVVDTLAELAALLTARSI